VARAESSDAAQKADPTSEKPADAFTNYLNLEKWSQGAVEYGSGLQPDVENDAHVIVPLLADGQCLDHLGHLLDLRFRDLNLPADPRTDRRLANPTLVKALGRLDHELDRRGLPYLVLTNSSLISRARLARWTTRLGFAMPPDRFVTALSASVALVRREFADRPIFVICSRDARTELEGLTLMAGEALDADPSAAAAVMASASWPAHNRLPCPETLRMRTLVPALVMSIAAPPCVRDSLIVSVVLLTT
jgi:hypothetical protein